MSRTIIHLGNCLDVLPTLADNSVDAVVTDPPYGLSFMGKKWDYDVPSVAVWAECLRVLKPGGHLLAFAGTRTQHRMCCRIEDAGFEIRDMIAWVYGSGFPKSLNVAKAVDAHIRCGGSSSRKLRQTDQETGGESYELRGLNNGILGEKKTWDRKEWEPATEQAKPWNGWGTALKPAMEPITVARKPLDGTVAANVQKWGTGAVNVDGCRVEGVPPSVPQPRLGVRERTTYGFGTGEGRNGELLQASGRWPANIIHDGSDEVVGMFPKEAGGRAPASGPSLRDENTSVARGRYNGLPGDVEPVFYGDAGSAARFFYCAKASKADRDDGLDGMDAVATRIGPDGHTINPMTGREIVNIPRRNHHPTVKPTDLMRYLCRLVTPPGGVVLDPFTGSGSTGKAAMLEGFRFIGIELDPGYVEIARARLAAEVGLFHAGLGVGEGWSGGEGCGRGRPPNQGRPPHPGRKDVGNGK